MVRRVFCEGNGAVCGRAEGRAPGEPVARMRRPIEGMKPSRLARLCAMLGLHMLARRLVCVPL